MQNPWEVLDSVSQHWESINNITFPALMQHTATVLLDGRILLVGGVHQQWGAPTNQAWLFNETANFLEQAPDFPGPSRVGHSATLLPDGRVLGLFIFLTALSVSNLLVFSVWWARYLLLELPKPEQFVFT